jgi:tetratricopeptide (TPR) repeat protein
MPSEPRYNAILAESYMNEKNYSKALQYYHRIEETNPGDENINISLASCYLAMGDMVGTYRYLRRGLMNGNIDCQHRLMYLTEFLRNKNFFAAYSRQGFMLADTLAAQCQPDDGHCMIYGQMLAAQERYAEAAEQFLKHLSHDKSQYAVWEALLVCEGTLPDRKGELMEHALQAAELFPLHLRPYLILAQGYYDEGNCERARYYMDRCMMIAPNEAAVKRLDQQIKQKCQ